MIFYLALHKAANLGLLAVVSSIVRFRPVLVNQKLEQKTVLMVAAYQGTQLIIIWKEGF